MDQAIAPLWYYLLRLMQFGRQLSETSILDRESIIFFKKKKGEKSGRLQSKWYQMIKAMMTAIQLDSLFTTTGAAQMLWHIFLQKVLYCKCRFWKMKNSLNAKSPRTWLQRGDSLSLKAALFEQSAYRSQTTSPVGSSLSQGRKRAAGTDFAGTNAVSAFQLLQVSQTGSAEASRLSAAPLLRASSGRFI